MDLKGVLRQVGKILDELGIPYFVTGGVAVVTWGRMRFTQDIDIVIALRREQIPTLAARLRALGEGTYIDEAMAAEGLERKNAFNFILPENVVKVDFWIFKDDPLTKLQLKRTVVVPIDGQNIHFLSPEDVILNKLLWYKESESSRHFEDAQSIVAIQGNKLDKQYLNEWAERQGTGDLRKQLFI